MTQQNEPANVVRTTQIIIGTLVTGMVVFGGVAMTSQNEPKQSILTIFAAGMAAVQILMWIVIPGIIVKSQLALMKDINEAEVMPRLGRIFQIHKIVGAALLEGAGFFNWVAYMLDRQTLTLGIVGTLIVLLASMFPTLGQFESWVDEKKRELNGQ